MVIALTGAKLAGKGTAAAYLAEHHYGKVLRCSALLVDILDRLHRQATRAELVKLGRGLRELYGDDVLALALRDEIMLEPEACWIIDGVRYVSELQTLQDLPQFRLLNIKADLQTRYQRTRQRTEKSDESSMTFEEFSRRETDVTEQGLQQLEQLATHTINNNGTIPEFYHQLDLWFETGL